MLNTSKQSGVALITALLIVAIATVTAVTMTSRQQLDIQRTSNLLNHDQAYLYLLGAEDWAQQILLQDVQRTHKDSADEMWAMQLPPLPILGGTVQGQLYDLHRCFNLNNLVQTSGEVSKIHQQYFERLLKLLDITPDITQQIIDWIDKNKEITLPSGAEDNAYLALTPKAYRTANQLLIHRSELRLLTGVDKKIYTQLAPYVCALPTKTRINVNFAPLELLLSLHEGLNPEDAQLLIEQREKDAFDSVQEFLRQKAFAGLEIDAKLLTVKSEYFGFLGKAEIGDGIATIHSIFQRKKDAIKTILRY
ncbi:type II secretion system minor pseudopilin GspK [Candidatus Albibeggiatoa sp. nov. NOAA]|uniref:type II secretion system minor pseudopilin GspK n=1 Tax=Candidatus Albibeggiatoa sp. nov. NOAA TaxID=3162724 RepID=UPI0033005099|nr:type II secretion system minor pseudopilin GspK [Thiotrichaceae bacterium]